MEQTSALKKTVFFILKALLVIILILAAFIIGAMLGYSVIGDGVNPMDIFNKELWQHIFNFIFN